MPTIVVRGLVLDANGRILLVSHAPSLFWYTPGGHLRNDESLTECLARELGEETGIIAEHSGIVLVDQVIEHERQEHKLELYFLARTSTTLPLDWRDTGGPIVRARFFAPDELAQLPQIFPTVLTPSYLQALANDSVKSIPYRDARPPRP